jgi:hypothetical protein
MKISEKRKKWLTKRAFFNCWLVSVGVFIISHVFELARMILSFELVFPINILCGSLALLLLTIMLWIYALLFPTFMETVFTMLGFKEDKEKEANDKNP